MVRKKRRSKFSFQECCQIWWFVANLATYHVKLELKFGLATCQFWLFFKIWLKQVSDQFKTSLDAIPLCSDVVILWKRFCVGNLGFQNCFDVGFCFFLKFGYFFLKLSGNTRSLLKFTKHIGLFGSTEQKDKQDGVEQWIGVFDGAWMGVAKMKEMCCVCLCVCVR